MNKSVNLQDLFLNQARKEKIMITVFLISGDQIRGFVSGFDNYTIVIDSDGKQQMIYKHAISTLIPSKNLDFMKRNNQEGKED